MINFEENGVIAYEEYRYDEQGKMSITCLTKVV